MRLHAFQLTDGTVHVVAERVEAALAAGAELTARDLGVADVELDRLSPPLVRGIGLDAWAVARGGDAVLIRSAIVRQTC
ncbi:hypothetical protein [Lysobacter xanthus]